MDEQTISSNINKIRKQKRMTLQELAERTGLTKGYLSKIERSAKAPPYSTLNRIAGALGIEVSVLLQKEVGPARDVAIVFAKKDDDRIIRETTHLAGYDYTPLATGKPGKNMEPFLIYAPFDHNRMYQHDGEEFIYVIDGQMELIYGDRTYLMDPGDHVYFDSRTPHSGRSLGPDKAKLLVVIYFYKRNRQ